MFDAVRLSIVLDNNIDNKNSMSLIIMNKLFQRCFFSACLCVVFLSTAVAGEVQLEGLDGKQHNFSEFIGKGKWTLLNIWGPKCPPCRDEMPDLVQFHDAHKDTDAIVVGIAIDFPSYGYANKKEVIEFAENFMIDFPLLLSDGSITERLGLGRLQGLPTTFMYSPEGEVVGTQVGGINREIIENFIKKHEKNKKPVNK